MKSDAEIREEAAELARTSVLSFGEALERLKDAAADAGTALKTAALALSREKPGKPTSARYRRAVRRLTRHQHAMTEHERIHARYQPSARELFPLLRELLLSSRPVVEEAREVVRYAGEGMAMRTNRQHVETIYGRPTFRNVLEIDENGQERLV